MESEVVDAYVSAGEIAKQVKEFARGLVKPGMKLIDLADAIDKKIFDLGGRPAFPVNLSLNEIAAHYTPEPEDETVAEGLLKVDIGVEVDGFIADTAFSVDLTEDKRYTDMIRLNEAMLADVGEKLDVDSVVKDVGDACQDRLEAWNEKEGTRYSIIKSLSGHELGEERIHAGLTISNYRNDNLTTLKGRAVAIEPFVTTGVGDVYEGEPGGIYVLQSEANVRDRDAREVLKFIREVFGTLPFCLRFVADEFESMSLAKLRYTLRSMVKQGILYEYPMLIEKSKGVVSQAENTFLFLDDEVRCTTD